jgi:DNA-binding NarL/FixJ family response regulator
MNLAAKTFLVLDRDEELRNGVERYLKMDGARSVQTTDNVTHGLEVLRSTATPVDCVISSEDLSPSTGVELLQGLRSGEYGNTPYMRGKKFVMLTAHREADLIVTVKKLDIDGFIVKPIDFDSFSHHIHLALVHTFELKPASHYSNVNISKAMRLPVLLKDRIRNQ